MTMSTTEPESSLLDAALSYAVRGWPVFPCHTVVDGACSCGKLDCNRPGKHPRTRHGLKDATTDPAQIHEWWTQWTTANIGLPTGPVSGIFVVDLDNEDAARAFDNLGRCPETLRVKTGRGFHVYFAYPNHGAIIRNNNRGRLGTHIDLKGVGGFVIAPPSLHASGALYAITSNHAVADAPAWLLENVTEPPPSAASTPADDQSEITKGNRNNGLTSLAGKLRRAGLDQNAIEAALLAHNEAHVHPPSPESEVRTIAQNIGHKPAPEDESEDGLLIMDGKPLAELVTDAEQILKAMPEERFYCTPGNRLIRVIQYIDAAQPDKHARRDPTANVMVELDALYLRLALSRSGKVHKWAKKQLVWANPSRELSEMILSAVSKSPERVTWLLLRMLSRAPILLPEPDNQIEKNSGYNQASKVWIDGRGITFADVAKKTKLSAEDCRALLAEHIYPIFELYAFAKEQPDQAWSDTAGFAVVLSAMMSIAARNLLPTVPMHCFDAPDIGCGKTKLAAAISVGATNTDPTAVNYAGATEFSKHLPALLEKGDRVVLLDNINMTMNCALLAIALTQEGGIAHRPLTTSTDKQLENQAVVLVTGNNLEISGDLRRRSLMARIEPPRDRPEYETFPFDPVVRAREWFPRVVVTILTLLRAHALAGFPGLDKLSAAQAMDLGSFSEWNRRIRACLLWTGHADPVTTQEAIRDADPAREADMELLMILRETFGDKEFAVHELRDSLDATGRLRVMELTKHKVSTWLRVGEPLQLLSSEKVGIRFRQLRGQRIDGYELKRVKGAHGIQKWRVVMSEQAQEEACCVEQARTF